MLFQARRDAGRACLAFIALGRSYFGRGAAPRALGPSIMPPAWTVPALPGQAAPKRKKRRPAGAASDIPIMFSARLEWGRACYAFQLAPPDGAGLPLPCFFGPGPALDLPGPLELDRVSLDRWTVSRCARPDCAGSPGAPCCRYGQRRRPPSLGPPGPCPGPPPPGPPLPARISPPAPTIFPRDFPPGSARDFPP